MSNSTSYKEEIDARFDAMSGFMQPDVTTKQQWYEIDGPMGTEWIPYDFVGDLEDSSVFACTTGHHDVPPELADYAENTEFYTISLVEGFGARLSAPGYLDCTDWSVFESEFEARQHLVENYADDDSEPVAK